jgi:hypothetical protein
MEEIVVNDEESTTAVAREPDRKANAIKIMLEALESGTPEQKALIRKAIGVAGPITKAPKRKGSNSQSRNHMLAYGNVNHQDNPDGTPWTPEPSEALTNQMGYDRAKAFIAANYLKNEDSDEATTSMTAREAEQLGDSGMSAEDMADIALEEFPTDAALADIGFSEDGG